MKKVILFLLFLIPVSQAQAQFGGGFFTSESVCLQDNLGYQIQLTHDFISGDLRGTFLLTGDGEVLNPAKTDPNKDGYLLPMSGPASGGVSPGFSYVVTKKRWRSYFQDAYSLNLTLGSGIEPFPFKQDPENIATHSGPGSLYLTASSTITAYRHSRYEPFEGYLSVVYHYPEECAQKDSNEKVYYELYWEGEFSEGACTRPQPSGWPSGLRAKSAEFPTEVSLSAAYPNPFNPATTIGYAIPEASDVSIKVFDLMGREVADLVNDFQSPGNYEVRFDASNLSSGTYMYVLQAGEYRETRQMVLMK